MWLFGCKKNRHRFVPRFSFSFPEHLDMVMLAEFINNLSEQRRKLNQVLELNEIGDVVKSFLNRDYVFDICVKCGEIRDGRTNVGNGGEKS